MSIGTWHGFPKPTASNAIIALVVAALPSHDAWSRDVLPVAIGASALDRTGRLADVDPVGS